MSQEITAVSVCVKEKFMINLHNKKTKQRVSAVIIIFVVIAMVLPTLAYFFA